MSCNAVAVQGDKDWRKGMGVEPTQQRVAPLTGFEARPTHQDRFPSVGSVAVYGTTDNKLGLSLPLTAAPETSAILRAFMCAAVPCGKRVGITEQGAVSA